MRITHFLFQKIDLYIKHDYTYRRTNTNQYKIIYKTINVRLCHVHPYNNAQYKTTVFPKICRPPYWGHQHASHCILSISSFIFSLAPGGTAWDETCPSVPALHITHITTLIVSGPGSTSLVSQLSERMDNSSTCASAKINMTEKTAPNFRETAPIYTDQCFQANLHRGLDSSLSLTVKLNLATFKMIYFNIIMNTEHEELVEPRKFYWISLVKLNLSVSCMV